MYTGNPLAGTLANNEDPDEMQHDAAFHQGLHCLLRLKQPLGTVMHLNLKNATHDPLKYKIESPIRVMSMCMGKSTRIQRVNLASNNLSVISHESVTLSFYSCST